MSRQGRTKEERVILTLYELATEQGEIDSEVSREAIMRQVGVNPRGMETICNVLAQANFIKKVGQESLKLTSQGERLVRELLQE